MQTVTAPQLKPPSVEGRRRRPRPLVPRPLTAGPNAPDVGAALAVLSGALRKTVGARGLRALNGLPETFAAPAAGRLVQEVYSPTAPKGAMPARAASRFLAAGEATFGAAGPGKLKLRLTAAGRRALRRRGGVKLAVVTRFIPAVGSATQRLDRFSARRATRTRRAAAKLVIPRWAWRPAAWACPSGGTRPLNGVLAPCH